MNVNKVKEGRKQKDIVSFDSIHEFNKYICETPLNDTFRWTDLHSSKQSQERTIFTGTQSFDEAQSLLKNGWEDMSNKISQKLKADNVEIKPSMAYRNTLGVQGFQPVVPLYLQGVPQNMASRRMVPVKQKIITLNKSISYSAFWTIDGIMEESIKAFKLIKRLEAQNYRCMLNLVFGSSSSTNAYVIKIKLKSPNEKLNISKLSFPLVNPSMLRRLIFRFIEVYPGVPKSFISTYGVPVPDNELANIFSGYLLPKEIKFDVNKIKSIDDLQKYI